MKVDQALTTLNAVVSEFEASVVTTSPTAQLTARCITAVEGNDAGQYPVGSKAEL